MSELKYIQVMVKGMNTPKGMRKPRSFLFNIFKLQDSDLENLDISLLKSKAETELTRMNKVDSATIIFRRAREDGDMVMVELFSSVPIASIKVV